MGEPIWPHARVLKNWTGPSTLTRMRAIGSLLTILGVALTSQAPSTDVSEITLTPRVFRSPASLRAWADSQPDSGMSPHANGIFRLDFPLVSADRTDLIGLQSPASWSVNGDTIVVSINLGAVTPENFKDFARDGLFEAPPLRTLYFLTERRGEAGAHTWVSYALAVPASARDHGRRGGDLPAGFAPPLSVSMTFPGGTQNAWAVRILHAAACGGRASHGRRTLGPMRAL